MPARLTVADAAVALHADWGAFQREVTKDGVPQAKTAGQKITAALGPTGIVKAFTVAGAAGGALFTGAIGGAVNFEDQLRTINTVAHLTDGELKGVGSSILDLSRETGKSTDDLTAGFYDLVSAGVPAKDAINVLRDSAKFATGALGSTGEAVDLVTSAMNAYGLKAADSTKITDVFAQAVADGKVTASELGASIAQIAPVAAATGVSMEEVAAGFALLTAKGVPAGRAAIQMQNAINALIKPNAELNKIQKETGINFAELAKTQGLQVALEKLREVTGGNQEAMTGALGSIEAFQFALASTGDNAGAYAAELGRVTEAADKGGVAQGQYDERMKSAKLQGDKMLASIHALAVEIGGPFTEVLGPAVSVVGQLGQGLHGLFLISSGLGGLLGRVLGGAWTRVASSGAVTALIKAAGSKAATAYLTALIAGEGISNALKGAWAAVTASGGLQGAVGAAGKFLGANLATFAAVAFAAVLVYKAIETYNDIKNQLGEQGKAIGEHVGEQIATGSISSLEQSKGALEQGIKDLAEVHDFGIFTNDARANLQKQLAAVDAEISDRLSADARSAGILGGRALALGVTQEFGSDLAAKISHVVTLSTKGAFGSDLAARSDYARSFGYRMSGAAAQGIRDGEDLVDQAWTVFLDAIKNVEEPTARAARLLGRLASKRLAAGLEDDRPEVKLRAEAVFQTTFDELNKIVDAGGKIGKKGMDQLKLAMHSKNKDVADAAHAIYLKATGQLDRIPAAGKAAGKGAGEKLTHELEVAKGPVGTAAANLATTIARKILGNLAGVERSLTGGARGTITGFAVGSPYIPYDQVAIVHQGERILTASENAAVNSGQATLGAGGDMHVEVEHHLDADSARNFATSGLDEEAIGRALAEAGNASGLLSNLRQLSAMSA